MYHGWVISGLPGGGRANPTGWTATNSVYKQFTMMATVDEMINANASKAPWKAKS